jgi:uncharacterized protein (TIGR02145 family)
MKIIRIPLLSVIVLFFNPVLFAQKEITAVFPADGAANVNKAVIAWSAGEGLTFDLYLGDSANPVLFKADLAVKQIEQVVLSLNSKYYWRVVAKKEGKEISSSKTFSFSTLPLKLNSSLSYSPFFDPRDQKIYRTIKIGDTEWFAQNLDYEIQGSSWYYEDSEANKIYGRLYSGNTLITGLNELCPTGWHIPSQKEWTGLTEKFGGNKLAGAELKDASDLYWRSSKYARTNKSGLTFLPAGSRDSKPTFSNAGKYAFFWTSTMNVSTKDSYYTIDLGFMRDNVNFNDGNREWSYSVRCVKDK